MDAGPSPRRRQPSEGGAGVEGARNALTNFYQHGYLFKRAPDEFSITIKNVLDNILVQTVAYEDIMSMPLSISYRKNKCIIC